MAQAPAKDTGGFLEGFIEKAGWAQAKREALAADWGVKLFERLTLPEGKKAILIVWNGAIDSFDNFVLLARELGRIDLSAPEIYAADEERQVLLCEDFGEIDFSQAIGAGENPHELYKIASEVLHHLFMSFQENDLELPPYKGGRLHQAKDLIVSHYFKGTQEQVAAYNDLWVSFEEKLPPCPQTLLHGDYHLHNLMWLPQREGIKRAGLIDLGTAMWGPVPYDLVNLLEDVRRDVPEEIKSEMRTFYCQHMLPDERDDFDLWYDVLTFQFHSRVIGQIVKLDRDDLKQHLPRLRQYIKTHLEKDIFAPFKTWLNDQGFSV